LNDNFNNSKKSIVCFGFIALALILLISMGFAYQNPETLTYYGDGLDHSGETFLIEVDSPDYYHNQFDRSFKSFVKVTNTDSENKHDFNFGSFFSKDVLINWVGEWKDFERTIPVYSMVDFNKFYLISDLNGLTCVESGLIDFNASHCYETISRREQTGTEPETYFDWKKAKAQTWQQETGNVPETFFPKGGVAGINIGKGESKYFVFDVEVTGDGKFWFRAESDDVGTTDGEHDPAWWESDYSYRLQIDTDINADAGGALTDFVGLIHLNSTDHSDFWGHTCADKNVGIDFVDDDDSTDLYWHAEDVNSTDAWYWVRIPSINYTSSDEIYLYYDNDDCTDHQDEANTYTSDFNAVYHTNDRGTLLADSTGIYNGTEAGDPIYRQVGQVGYTITADGTGDWFVLGFNLNGQSTATTMMWIKPSSAGANWVFGNYVGENDAYQFYEEADETLQGNVSSGASRVTSQTTSALSSTAWHHVALVHDGTNQIIYYNGVAEASSAFNTNITTPTDFFALGRATNKSFAGSVDEIKVLATDLSVDDIIAYFKSEGTQDFFTVSAEKEPNNSPAITLIQPNGVDGNYLSGTQAIVFDVNDVDLESNADGDLLINVFYSTGAFGFANSLVSDGNLFSNTFTFADTNFSVTRRGSWDWDTTLVADGNYFIDLNAWDFTDSNAIDSSNASFMVDNTAPSTSDDHNAGWQSTNASVILSCSDGSGSGCFSTAYRIDFGAWQSYSVPISFTDGNKQLDYNSVDNVGKEETTNSVWVAVDSITDYNAGWQSTDQNIVLTCTDGDGNNSGCSVTSYRIDLGSWASFDANILFTDGSKQLDYNSTDGAGGVETTNFQSLITMRVGSQQTKTLC